MVLGVEDSPEDCCKEHKRTREEDGMLLIFLEKLAKAGFPDMNSAFLIVRGARVLAVTGMAAALVRGALLFSSCFASWLQARSRSLVAQTLHPTGAGFLASTTGLGASPLKILDPNIESCLPYEGHPSSPVQSMCAVWVWPWGRHCSGHGLADPPHSWGDGTDLARPAAAGCRPQVSYRLLSVSLAAKRALLWSPGAVDHTALTSPAAPQAQPLD
ncbi:hypothetical protein H920_05314 [Fukomys damarensis]|uniref:Uncharacterized protein n=1 Tax=Fukomys damarensis TaxID=885580 RepID=A0A091ECT9_FUKDA|nr:hypothetical protein H920_05314 [Fukomys damarensis]